MANYVDIPEEGTLTCQSCRVHVTEAELDGGHYRSQWHRYNVKRKCNELPPVAREEFERQLSELQASQNTEKPKPHSFECALCRKTYSSEAALTQHNKTKKHLKKAASQPQQAQPQPGAQLPPPSSSTAQIEGASASSSASPQISSSPPLSPLDSVPSIPVSSTSSSKKSLHQDQGLSDALSALAVEQRLRERHSAAHEGGGSDDEEDEEGGMFDDGDSDGEDEEVGEGEGKSMFDADSDAEDAAGDSEPIPLGTCLFSGKTFDKLEDCLEHMLKKYGFFIPSVEHLVSVEDLLTYLGAKIGVGHECLYCTRKAAYNSLLAVRQHMIAKNHCKLRFDEDDGELDEFYDYSTTTANADDEDGDATMSSSKELTLHEPRRMEDLMASGEILMTDGSFIGTRDLHRYYKQRVRPERQSKRSEMISSVTSKYRMLQLPGYAPGSASIRETKRSQQRAAKWRMRLGSKNNKTMMKHFRAQCLF